MTFFWDELGVDDGGLPVHLPMGVNAQGEGPEDDAKAHHYMCWCGNRECPLTQALHLAWSSGTRFHPRARARRDSARRPTTRPPGP